ncbi:D-glycero-beta-D-manno-heptose-1,7-bisphosphate 7-phosphatase [Magnetospirillum sp. LM-5]|uniref:D-glycero-beta-D-manno-heptose 1,7-bisphosphate 7-phosphatase n=1 Tax=Magnetospirillum sp. LM-5 TaxID=2681466 RepID=UPI0013806D33|nr:D-glycero-beta-D-manno-heptose 1,7-bisphosphate 7-phosphatase [Magnetospirillum sp. LM-5]CAA7618778.1 D-glycero-beta-D-manno-heptose-1,7-bisphosphate 7-phosphatase [Magnetospirillum sp. LM-5]
MARKFALIDRDGTINVEKHYLSDPDQLELYPGVGASIRRLNEAGWGVVVITNQSGIARGYFDMARLDAIHARLTELLAAEGARIDGIYLCPHGPDDDCDCRKPLPGMVEQAVAEHGFDPAQAVMIGDKEVDVELGLAVGADTFLVRTGHGHKHVDGTKAAHVVDDLGQAVAVILGG